VLPIEIMALLDKADALLGSDEAGYGAYAGPLVVSAVLAPKDWVPPAGLTDSKKMSDGDRRETAKALIADPRIFWQTLWTHAPEIDEENVYYANIRMHTHVIEQGLAKAEALYPGKRVIAVVDGNLQIPHAASLPKADRDVLVCSAASVLAKVARDTWMEKLDTEYPGYGFASSKGYGTPAHQAALVKLGVSNVHRKSFAPIAAFLKKNEISVLDLMEILMGDD
jgi:ribonuclease HII